MNLWSFAFFALVLMAASAGKIVNPGYAHHGPIVFSGKPVTTLHTPVTP